MSMLTAVERPAGPPTGLYGVGNLIDFRRDTLHFLTQAAEKYGDVVYYRMTFFHFYQINHPDYVHEVLIKQGRKLEKWQRQTATWANAVGHSTLTMEGDEWQRNRRILNPSFHAQTVTRYHDLVVAHTRRLLDQWRGGGTYEMMFEMMRTTMGIISDIIFGVEDIARDAADLNEALTVVFEVLMDRTTAFQQLPDWLPTRDNLRLREASRVIENFIMGQIRARRAAGEHRGDVLSDLIEARDEETGVKLSDQEICNELKTLFGAGHDTTALMLMWTLHLLSQHPQMQEALRDEVVGVLGDRAPTLADLPQMPTVEQTLRESMRLFPPAWSLMVRKANEDIQLNETVIPAGSIVLLPMWVVHRNPKIYPDPLRFDPARFAGDYRKRFGRYAFFPFGGGPRVCIGSHLAMLEGQIILPMMLQRYRFEAVPQPEIELLPLLTLRPKDGLWIKVVER
jgi:cytochrome P450